MIRLRRALVAAGLLLAGILAVIGLQLLVDRPGLRVEYFAIDPAWRGRPADTDIGLPRLESRRAAGYRLLSHELFSIRWRGWIRIEREGRYRFAIDADERAYLALDGIELASIAADGAARGVGRRRLEPGWHRLEIGMTQTGGAARLDTGWSPPGVAGTVALPRDALYAERTGWLRRGLRRWSSPLSPALRRLLGAGLLLAAAAGLAAAGRRALGGLAARRFTVPGAGALRAVWPLAVFVVVWWLVFRFTARTVDGDDIRYLDVAMFDRKVGWILNRYSHVYLVRFFVWLTGEGFAAGRQYWSFMLAGTAAALTMAVGALGPRLQIRTLVVTFFLLASQVTVWATIGAAFADYSAMLFVTAGVAVYLVGRARENTVAWEWPALAIGAFTVLAYRAKETGIILVWLLLLLAWCGGRIDWRRFVRRALWWMAGAAAAYLGLMCLDGLLLGDFWFSLRPDSVEALQQLNFADLADVGRSSGGWMEILWQPGGGDRPRDLALRHLALLVTAGAFVAAAQHRRVETCALHLMPFVYVALLLAAHVRANFVHSPRHLLPIVPVGCLLGAALFHHLGLEEPPWRKLFAPPVLLALAPAAAIVWLIMAPYRIGELAADQFVPSAALARFGWSAADFVDVTLGPLVALLLVAALALSLRAPRTRLVVALVCLPFLFGTAFELSRLSLARGGAVQRGDLILYPWDAFGAEIDAASRRRVFVSSEIFRSYGMGGQRVNRNRIARLYFGRDGMSVHEIVAPVPEADLIVASRREHERWREEVPDFRAAAVSTDATGELVLLRRPRPDGAGPGSSAEPAPLGAGGRRR